MTRGIETLFYKRHLLNPFRYGLFAWMLLSHKLVRWLVPWAVLISVAILAMLYRNQPLVPYALLAVALAGLLAVIGWLFPRVGARSKIFSVPAYMLAGFIASLHAWLKALSGDLDPIWEPTRRGSAAPSGPAS
jgi:hypothetical protein